MCDHFLAFDISLLSYISCFSKHNAAGYFYYILVYTIIYCIIELMHNLLTPVPWVYKVIVSLIIFNIFSFLISSANTSVFGISQYFQSFIKKLSFNSSLILHLISKFRCGNLLELWCNMIIITKDDEPSLVVVLFDFIIWEEISTQDVIGKSRCERAQILTASA